MKRVNSVFIVSSKYIPRSPRSPNSAEYAESCRNWPKLIFKRPAALIFSRIPKTDKITIRKQLIKLHEKNAGSETLRQKSKRGHLLCIDW